MVTLAMVAHAAGVSTGTVSRTLNGSPSVSEAKRQAVLEAVRHLGFRPNPVARGLAGGRTLSVGRRAATAEARISDAKGRLLAHATTTCLVFELPATSPVGS